MKKILVMGLPGSGKTTFAGELKKYLENRPGLESILDEVDLINRRNSTVTWFNADEVRKKYNDWDFSYEGRIRQSLRMAEFALSAIDDYVICDFVAPLKEMRKNFKADWTIWLDTIDRGRFEDTNKAFVPPENYDFRIPEQNAEKWVPIVGDAILSESRRPVFDWKKETVEMLGRWQPWHPGHRALFERAIAKTGQVVIMIRDCQGWNESNPFTIEQVKDNIKKDLDPIYQGKYEILVVPNITNITYGRGVGYTITEEILDEETQKISATNIRKEMGLK